MTEEALLHEGRMLHGRSEKRDIVWRSAARKERGESSLPVERPPRSTRETMGILLLLGTPTPLHTVTLPLVIVDCGGTGTNTPTAVHVSWAVLMIAPL